MTSIIFLLIFLCLPSFFKYVEWKWKKDNNLLVIHVEKDFMSKYQEYLIKKEK